VFVGDDVPNPVATALDAAVTSVRVEDVSDSAVVDRVREIFAAWRGPSRVEGGPVYVFPGSPALAELPPGVCLVDSNARADQLKGARPDNWEDEEWTRLIDGELGPWVMAVGDGEVVAICHSPMLTVAGAGCGVWTHPAHRRKGLAVAVTSAWARLVCSSGRQLFYGADRDNTASQAVAARLGLRLIGWDWFVRAGDWPQGDAFGRALADHLVGRYVPRLELENDRGRVAPALRPEWFFRQFDEWDWWDQELLPRLTAGPVLDLGAGAGRAALWLQDRGLDVTAIDASPLAAHVCHSRGVRDVRISDLNNPPADQRWQAVLLLCGNLGLGGSYAGIRRLLGRLADVCAPGAVLVGDTVDTSGPPDVGLRIRYGGQATPWWRQYNIPVSEVPALIDGTGWLIDRHIVDLPDHALLLRRR
jgi:SAM-dependent methyltransferase